MYHMQHLYKLVKANYHQIHKKTIHVKYIYKQFENKKIYYEVHLKNTEVHLRDNLPILKQITQIQIGKKGRSNFLLIHTPTFSINYIIIFCKFLHNTEMEVGHRYAHNVSKLKTPIVTSLP